MYEPRIVMYIMQLTMSLSVLSLSWLLLMVLILSTIPPTTLAIPLALLLLPVVWFVASILLLHLWVLFSL